MRQDLRKASGHLLNTRGSTLGMFLDANKTGYVDSLTREVLDLAKVCSISVNAAENRALRNMDKQEVYQYETRRTGILRLPYMGAKGIRNETPIQRVAGLLHWSS